MELSPAASSLLLGVARVADSSCPALCPHTPPPQPVHTANESRGERLSLAQLPGRAVGGTGDTDKNLWESYCAHLRFAHVEVGCHAARDPTTSV